MSNKSFNTFKDFFGLLRVLNEELTLYVDEEGIQVSGMDPSHVAMVDAKILPGLFEKFEPSEKKLTINLSEFCKFLDRIGKDERPTIQYDAEKGKLIILARKTGYTRRFTLSTLEPLDEEIPKPKIFFKAEGRILTESVVRALKDGDLVSEYLKIMFTKDMLQFNASGDIGSARNEFEKGSDELLQLKVEEDAEATFTLSYLTDMLTRLEDLADVVTISLAEDMPVKIEAEPNDPNLEITLYLAPCIGV